MYLADFDIAEVLNGTISTTKTSSSAGPIGTPDFQPVKQLQAGVITKSVDVYALGYVIVWGEKGMGGCSNPS